MSEMPAGWYTDPAPANPAFPTTMRFWDGRQWTAQTRAASRKELTAWREALQGERHREAVAHAEQVAYAQEHGIAAPVGNLLVEVSPRDVTPDGQTLARWGRRYAACLLDTVVTMAIGSALGWSILSRIGDAYADFVRLSLDAARDGTSPPDANVLTQAVGGQLALFMLVLVAVSFVYSVVFLKAFSATPGKMALGLEVRLREMPGPLTWRTVLLRWVTQNLGGFVRLVPVVGVFGFLYSIIDGLWPLWDEHRQALHDKAAGTNVVRR
jgi:uncharacterized RDD family membrane protein YckC